MPTEVTTITINANHLEALSIAAAFAEQEWPGYETEEISITGDPKGRKFTVEFADCMDVVPSSIDDIVKHVVEVWSDGYGSLVRAEGKTFYVEEDTLTEEITFTPDPLEDDVADNAYRDGIIAGEA